jgi:hypothetical protein
MEHTQRRRLESTIIQIEHREAALLRELSERGDERAMEEILRVAARRRGSGGRRG